MSIRNLLKVAVIGAAIYGAYKLGEKQGKEKNKLTEKPEGENKNLKEFGEDDEINYLYNLIDSLDKKKNKTTQEKNTLDLLRIKLKQLIDDNNR